MNDQIEVRLPENPFTPDHPVPGGQNFVGRARAFAWLEDKCGQAPANQPLTISGAPGMGKTSFLNQLVADGIGDEVVVLYTDIGALETNNLSAFLWTLAKAMMAGMESQGFSGPTIEKRMLVLNPQLVFKQRFWQPLLNRAQENPLLLAWDNFDLLAETSISDHNVQTLRAYLYGLLDTRAPINLLLTVTGRVEAIAESSLSPFRLANTFRLTNLSRDQTLNLVRSSDQLPIAEPVGNFIHELTAGHPGDVQCVSHALFNRHLERMHGQVTAADVLAVLNRELSPSDFHGAVYRRLASTRFTLDRPAVTRAARKLTA